MNMKKLKPFDLSPLSGNTIADITVKFLTNFARYKNINKLYQAHAQKAADQFVDSILQELKLDFYVNENDLKNIPKSGGFIVVANFPLGGIEGLILYKIFKQIRNDIKLIVTRKFHQIKPLNEISLPLPDRKGSIYTISYLKRIYSHLHNGHPIIVFPAVKPAKYHPKDNLVVDSKWDTDVIRLIRAIDYPVVPAFINNQNSLLFHVLGIIHPVFQALMLDRELKRIKNQIILVRIGKPIQHQTLINFDLQTAIRYLRARVFALGVNIEVNQFKFSKSLQPDQSDKFEPIIDPIDPKLIKEQINQAKRKHLQFSVNEYDILISPTHDIPDVITEIGRLRELTFRPIGEGTGKSLDLDEYDLYYEHLIIWDRKKSQIVGAYRLGKGDQLLEKFGLPGFYTYSLFKYKKEFVPYLQQALELGRAFIIPEYQRKALPLFLLWKGILYYLLKNINYRYLIGPVSISGKFSDLSKSLIINFFKKHYLATELTKYVKPRKPFKAKFKNIDTDVLAKEIGNNINKLDNIIKDIEGGAGIPVLFKKYINLGAKVITFNVDPDFNYSIDGLMLLDVYDVPQETVKALAKELDENQLLKRFSLE